MRLAVVDPHDNILIAWPTVAEAHDALAHQFAAAVAPGRFQKRKRQRLATQLVEHLLDLQHQTIRL